MAKFPPQLSSPASFRSSVRGGKVSATVNKLRRCRNFLIRAYGGNYCERLRKLQGYFENLGLNRSAVYLSFHNLGK